MPRPTVRGWLLNTTLIVVGSDTCGRLRTTRTIFGGRDRQEQPGRQTGDKGREREKHTHPHSHTLANTHTHTHLASAQDDRLMETQASHVLHIRWRATHTVNRYRRKPGEQVLYVTWRQNENEKKKKKWYLYRRIMEAARSISKLPCIKKRNGRCHAREIHVRVHGSVDNAPEKWPLRGSYSRGSSTCVDNTHTK